MRKLSPIVIAALFGIVVAHPAIAGDTYKFNLHNQSSDYTITGFRTYEDGKWSKNWIDFTLKPGEEAEMDWGSDEGNCVVPFKVEWKGYQAEKFSVDFCKVHNLYMKDSGFKYD
jgi:hypothetical protein